MGVDRGVTGGNSMAEFRRAQAEATARHYERLGYGHIEAWQRARELDDCVYQQDRKGKDGH